MVMTAPRWMVMSVGNDRTSKRPKPKRVFENRGLVRAHSAGHPWPPGDPLAQARSVPPKQGSHNPRAGVPPSARIPPGSEAGVRRAAVEQPAGHRDRQLPPAGAHPELRPARPDRDAERLDGVRERRSRGPRRRERRVDRVCP